MRITIQSTILALTLNIGLISTGVIANDEIENYVLNSWQYRALMLQSQIDLGTPLREASILMTHNSFNSDHYSNMFSYIDPNQNHSVTEQLDLGVRLLELDAHWFSGNLKVCHAGDDHLGCSSYDGILEDRIAEINTWIRRPEHSDQVVFIYIEDHMDDHYGDASLILDKYFSDKIYAPSSCNAAIPTSLTKADVLNAGKQIVMYGGSYSCTATSGSNWGSYVHGVFFSTDNSGLSSVPDCLTSKFNPSYIAANITRVFEDRTVLSDWFGSPPPPIDAAYAKTLVDCGINIISLDMLDDNDSRHGAIIWSWDINEPNDYANGEDCAVHKSNGKLNDVSCGNHYNFACLDDAGDWQVSIATDSWSEGATICDNEFSGSFAMHKNGYQNYLLSQAQAGGSTWVNYSDRTQEGQWIVGDAPTINLPPADNRIVYRQLKNGKGKCLDLQNGSTQNGANIHQWDCHKNAIDPDLQHQLWYQDSSGRIHSKSNPNQCLDVSGSGSFNGTAVNLWSCHSGANQQWNWGTNNSLRPAHAPQMGLDVNGGGGNNGADTHIWNYDGGKSGMWFWFTPDKVNSWNSSPRENVSFKGAHGDYFVSIDNGGGDVKADRSRIGEWEKFELNAINSIDSCIRHGDLVTIRTGDDYYWIARSGGGLSSVNKTVGNAEKFSLINHSDSIGCLQSGDTLSLLGAYNKYVVAESNGDANANRSAIGSWEKFQISFN